MIILYHEIGYIELKQIQNRQALKSKNNFLTFNKSLASFPHHNICPVCIFNISQQLDRLDFNSKVWLICLSNLEQRAL